MNLLENEKKTIDVFIDHINEFLSYIKTYYEIDEIDKLQLNLDKTQKKVKITDDLFVSYGILKSYYLDVEKIMTSIEAIKITEIEVTDSTKIEIDDELKKLLGFYIRYKKVIDEINAVLITKISTDVYKDIIDNKDLDGFHDKFVKNPNCIKLYAKIVQQLLDYYYVNDKTKMFELLKYLDDDKNTALELDRPKSKTSKASKKIATNPIPYRFGLQPITEALELDELLPIILLELNSMIKIVKPIRLQEIATDHKIGFIIINHVTYTPIEFVSRPLLVKSEADKYMQPSEYGINEKIVERFKLIKEYPVHKKWDFSMSYINIDDVSKFYVLDTLDGKHYRCLAPWMQSTTYSLPKHRVEKLLNPRKVSRATMYHSLCQKTALKNMFLGRAIETDSLTASSEEIKYEKIQDNLLEAIKELIMEIVRSEYKGTVHSQSDIYAILHDERIANIFCDTLIITYKVGIEIEELLDISGGKFGFSELLSTFTEALQSTVRNFMRDLHTNYDRHTVSKLSEFKSDEVLAHMLDLVKICIEANISKKDNPFTGLHIKFICLNFFAD